MGEFGNTRNMIIAVVASIVIFTAWQLFFEAPRIEREQQLVQEQQELAEQQQQVETQENAEAVIVVDGDEVNVVESPRVTIETPLLRGSIRLAGALFDDLILKGYHVTEDPRSPEIVLLAGTDTEAPYFIDVGWDNAEGEVEVPGPTALWETEDEVLSPGAPVTLTWTNGSGVVFEREIAVDDGYMFTVTQRVINDVGASGALRPTALTERRGLPETTGFFVLHEGPMGVFDETLEEYEYDDLSDDGLIQHLSTGGWLGYSDKYWLVALVPDQTAPITGQFSYERGTLGRYQVGWVENQPFNIAEQDVEVTTHFFAGAKVVGLLDQYEEELSVPLFDRAVDFGWFYFLTKPLFELLHWIYTHVGNFGVAIMCLTVIVRLILYPLANKSYKSMSRMKKLGPQMQAMRERFKDDRQAQQREMMALYKREKVNPAAGCLPILVQIPVFFALYKVLLVSIEMRHAPFVLWITDLSAPDPTSIFNLYGLLPFDPPSFLLIGVLPTLMGLSMWAQQRLNPAPADPIQAKIFAFLPLVFTFLLAGFAAGLVLYWTTNNLLSLAQQYIIMRRMGAPIGRKAGEAERKRIDEEAKLAVEKAKEEQRQQREQDRQTAPAPTKPFKPKKARGAPAKTSQGKSGQSRSGPNKSGHGKSGQGRPGQSKSGQGKSGKQGGNRKGGSGRPSPRGSGA